MLQNKTFENLLIEKKSLIILLVLIAIVSYLSDNFFTLNNFFNILQQTSTNAIIAVGMTLVILTFGIDLTVGSIFAIAGAITVFIIGLDVSSFTSIAAFLALGALLDSFSGIFIATLVMMLISK